MSNEITNPAALLNNRKPLLGVTKGKIAAPARILIYGVEGVGKTSTAAKAEDVVFLCKEAGTEQLDIARLPEPTHWRDAPDGRDVISLTDSLRFSEHSYKALAVDTVDWIEPMLFKHICDSDPKSKGNIVLAYGGYGKGYDVAINEWRAWLAQLDCLRRERGMHIVLLAHSQIKKFSNPEGNDFDRYQLKMHEKGAGLIKEWADAVLFAHQEVYASDKGTDEKKKYGVGSNTRYLFTERRPAWDAKNRFGLPERMPLSWPDLMQAIKAKSPEHVAALVARIREQAVGMSKENQDNCVLALGRAGQDPEKLSLLLNWVQTNQVAK